MTETRLRQLSEEKIVELNPPQPVGGSTLDKAAFEMLLLGIKALSQRTVVALGNLFTLLTAFSAFWLWYSALPAPDAYQLISLAFYGVFVLALNWIVRRKQ